MLSYNFSGLFSLVSFIILPCWDDVRLLAAGEKFNLRSARSAVALHLTEKTRFRLFISLVLVFDWVAVG